MRKDNNENGISIGTDSSQGGVYRGFAIIRALAAAEGPLRLNEVAKITQLPQATTHRILKALIAERVVEQPADTKTYRLSIDFFALAATANNTHPTLRSLCRPALLRLSNMLNDTVFLLVRAGFDGVCLDRAEGPFPIRTHTGNIGGRVPLGIGQGGMVILALLPEAEREEIIQFNVPRLSKLEYFDEIYVRTAIERTREWGYATNAGLNPLAGMAGVAVAIQDRNGYPVAALSIGTLAERVNDERLPMIVKVLRREADKITEQLNPFDPTIW